MPLSSPALAWVLPLLLLTGVAAAQPAPPRCEADVRRITLDRAPQAPLPELCIQAGRATTLLFDGPLATGVSLEGRERFRQVEVAGRALVLVPAETLAPGTRLRLEVAFQEGGGPERAAFLLVASPQAERQVEISRPSLPPGAPGADLEQSRAELQQCRQERAQLEARLARKPTLAEVSASFELTATIEARKEVRLLQAVPASQPPVAAELITLSLPGSAAIRLLLPLPGGAGRLERATLTGTSGTPVELPRVLSRETASASGPELFLEVPQEARSGPGPFTLTLWEASGARAWSIPDVRFP